MNIKKVVHDVLNFLGVKLKDVADHIPTIVSILGKIKDFVDNPTVDEIAALFIGAENEIAIKEALDHVLIMLTKGSLIEQDVINAKSAIEKLAIVSGNLKNLHPTNQHLELGKIATLVTHYLSKNELSVNQASLAVTAEIEEMRNK